MNLQRLMSPAWAMKFTQRYVPFADAASSELPLGRLLRLSLFQLSIGMTMALLVGTLNRVMIVELGVPAWWVALSVALPLVFAPLRALIGYRSDTHPSALGLKRLPYMWIGTLLMFGGLAIMPFALLLLSLPQELNIEIWTGRVGAALAFLLVGAGMQITQTAGLALASDIAPEDKRPRVVALMYGTLLVGMVLGSAVLGWVLQSFRPTLLVQVVQGAAVLVVLLNVTAMWQQEARQAKRGPRQTDGFSRHWTQLMAIPKIRRYLWTLGLGTVAFSMQDVILEPFGGEVLGMNVGLTSSLTAMSAAGGLLAFALSSRILSQGVDSIRLAAGGALLGLPAFACVIFSAAFDAPWLFQTGAGLIGFSGGLFAVGMLLTAMDFPESGLTGLVLGAWGAVQATAAGLSMAMGGVLRDVVGSLAAGGWLGTALNDNSTGYSFVFHLEIYLLFVVLIALGPLVKRRSTPRPSQAFGLAELPG